MNKQIILVTLFILGIIIGITAASFVSIGFVFLPEGHQNIADQITVHDDEIWMNTVLEPVCIRSGETTAFSVVPLDFYTETNVPYSFWEFRYAKDDGSTVGATMMIYGPTSHSVSDKYMIQISRLAISQITVTFPEGYWYTFPRATAEGSQNPINMEGFVFDTYTP